MPRCCRHGASADPTARMGIGPGSPRGCASSQQIALVRASLVPGQRRRSVATRDSAVCESPCPSDAVEVCCVAMPAGRAWRVGAGTDSMSSRLESLTSGCQAVGREGAAAGRRRYDAMPTPCAWRGRRRRLRGRCCRVYVWRLRGGFQAAGRRARPPGEVARFGGTGYRQSIHWRFRLARVRGRLRHESPRAPALAASVRRHQCLPDGGACWPLSGVIAGSSGCRGCC